MKKKLIMYTIGILSFLGMSIIGLSAFAANPPQFDRDFASHLSTGEIRIYNPQQQVIHTNIRGQEGKGFWGQNLSEKNKYDNVPLISKDKSLIENIQSLLVPSTTNPGILGNMLKSLAVGLIFVYLVYVGIQLMVKGNNADGLKDALRSLLYISIGSLFIYGAGWFFGDVLNFGPGGMIGGVEGVVKKVATESGSVLFQILSFLKGAAFFFAIAMIVVTGFRVIAAADADKSKKLVRGLLNVVGALVIMKVVDFVYYIAQAENFAQQAISFIKNVAKFCGYIYGAIAVLMVFYAGYSFLTDGGGGDGMKRAKTILINLAISGLVLFGFLLILYQVFKEFS